MVDVDGVTADIGVSSMAALLWPAVGRLRDRLFDVAVGRLHEFSLNCIVSPDDNWTL